MDKLNTTGGEFSSERQETGPSSSTAAQQSEQSRLQREFEFTMAMANLISELVRVMGWDRNRQPPVAPPTTDGGLEETKAEVNRRTLRSIFQPRFSASPVMTVSTTAAPAPPKKKANGFRTRTDFATRSAYVEYVQDTLKSGMQVRMLEDYEEVSAGDEGEFRYSNDGSPPVQVDTVFGLSPCVFLKHCQMFDRLCDIVVGVLELNLQNILGALAHDWDPG